MTTMKNKRFIPAILSLVIVFAAIISSCKIDDKDPSSSSAHLEMYLIDAPADYDAVYIDVQAVEIISNEGTTTFNLLNPGVYDLLKFNSGVDTLMISEDMSPRTVTQIRLILGSNNSVVVDGVTHPLDVPSGETSGLKLNVHYTFEAGVVYKLWLDFDAAQSIVEKGDGSYSLKPVIRVFTESDAGSIRGTIFPLGAAFHVSAITATDTFGTAINLNGNFQIMGLPSGTYDVKFTAIFGFADITVPGVSVTNGSVTEMGEIVITP